VRECVNDLRGHARLVAEKVQDGAPRRIGERFPYGIERVRLRSTFFRRRFPPTFPGLRFHGLLSVLFQLGQHVSPALAHTLAMSGINHANGAVAQRYAAAGGGFFHLDLHVVVRGV
jgi:hypothetical protein